MKENIFEQYYNLENTHWWFSGMRLIYKKMIKQFNICDNYSLILDVGCGPGMILNDFKKYGDVFGFDKSQTALEFCKKRGVGTRIFQATATRIPIKTESVDCVTSFGVIEHIDEQDDVLSELFRVCKPGAKAILMTSAFKLLWSYHDEIVGHKRRYSINELKDSVKQAGFIVNRISYINAFIFPAVLVIRLLQRLINFRPKNYEKINDLFVVPKPINIFLKGILALESLIVPFINLPFGVNIIAVIQKPLLRNEG